MGKKVLVPAGCLALVLLVWGAWKLGYFSGVLPRAVGVKGYFAKIGASRSAQASQQAETSPATRTGAAGPNSAVQPTDYILGNYEFAPSSTHVRAGAALPPSQPGNPDSADLQPAIDVKPVAPAKRDGQQKTDDQEKPDELAKADEPAKTEEQPKTDLLPTAEEQPKADVRPMAQVPSVPDVAPKTQDVPAPPERSEPAGRDATNPEIPQSLTTSSAAAASHGPSPNLDAAASRWATGPVTVPEAASRALLVSQVAPSYPESALQAGIEGDVVLQALIGKDGSIRDLKLVNGPLALGKAAFDAVRQWRFQPYRMNGEIVEIQTLLTVSFKHP